MQSSFKVFKDDKLNQKLKNRGFLLLNYASKIEVENIKREIAKLKPTDGFEGKQKTKIPPQTFHCTYFDTDRDYKNSAFLIVYRYFKNFISEYLSDYQIIQSNIFVKPAKTGYVTPHQNLTVVDEEKYTSISLWSPMQDTTTENGTLYLAPKSHKKYAKYRSSEIHWPYLEQFEKNWEDEMEPIDVKEGQILIFDDSIVHASKNNGSASSRNVLHAICKPEIAASIYCTYNHHEDCYGVYEVDNLFWFNHLPGKVERSKGRLLFKEKK